MDKAMGKLVYASAGIDVLAHEAVDRTVYAAEPDLELARCRDRVGFPCYAKPNALGSSIGVTRCTSEDELRDALEICLELDRRALVEPALDDAIELNVAMLGRAGNVQASLVEQPVPGHISALSFEDKHLRGAKELGRRKDGAADGGGSRKDDRGGAEALGGSMASQDRVVPADIPERLAERIRALAMRAHETLNFAGVVRYDFLVEDPYGRDARVILNEANTVPGSFAFYLYEPMGLSFPELGDALLDIALAEAAERRATTRTSRRAF